MGIEIAGMGFVLGILTLITIVIGLAMKVYQSRITTAAEIARDQAYRKLAEEAVAAQQKNAENLADIRKRVTEIEKMLREVE